MSAADPPVVNTQASGKKHRREVRLYIWLPFALGVLLIIICLALVMSPMFPPPRGEYQVSIVSNTLLMVFMLCPAVICLFVPLLGLIAAVFAMNKAHTLIAKPLRQVEDLTETLEQRTQEVTSSINRQTINVSSRFAILNKWLGVFERPKGQDKK